MKPALRILLVVGVFAAGCYATTVWPDVRPRLARLLEPVTAHLEAAELAEARQAEILTLPAELARCHEQVDALECEVAAARQRAQQFNGELLAARQESDRILVAAQRAADRYSKLCQTIRSIDLTGELLQSLERE